MGWEGAGTAAADLSVVEEPEENEAPEKVRLHRFHYRALFVSLTPTMGNRGGAIEQCVNELRKLLKLRPGLPQYTMNLHWGLTVLRREKEADEVADAFFATDTTEPQSCSYFARAFSKRKKYDEALKLVDRTRQLDDYLGDEIALERMRAYAGKGDVARAIKAYETRIDELKADLDQFHFAYHLAIAMDERGSEFAALSNRLHHGLTFGAGGAVTKVDDGTPGAEAGVRPGDVIAESLDTRPVLAKNGESIAVKVTRGAEKLELKLKVVSVYLHEMERLAFARDKEGKRRLIHVLMLAAAYSRLLGEDAQIELLAGAVEEFKGVFGFRHYVYRTVFRILETGGKDTPD